MNKQLKKRLQLIQDKLSPVISDLEEISTEASEKLDQWPENLQSGERYDKAQEQTDTLDMLKDNAQELYDEIQRLLED